MTPEQFVARKGSQLGERQASQELSIDLCWLLDEKTPAEADATGESYCFERGAAKMEGRRVETRAHRSGALLDRLARADGYRPSWSMRLLRSEQEVFG